MKEIILRILAMMSAPDLVTSFHGIIAFGGLLATIYLLGFFAYRVLELLVS